MRCEIKKVLIAKTVYIKFSRDLSISDNALIDLYINYSLFMVDFALCDIIWLTDSRLCTHFELS
jgi:hypothetical protein